MNDLNIRAKTIKLLQESIGINLCDLGLANGLFDMTPKTQASSGKVDKLNLINIKNFVYQKTLLRK